MSHLMYISLIRDIYAMSSITDISSNHLLLCAMWDSMAQIRHKAYDIRMVATVGRA
jgi:hypothetical protein